MGNENKERQEKIERYLENLMTEEEKKAFELELERDENLKAEFELFQQIISGIRKTAILDRKKKLTQLHRELFSIEKEEVKEKKRFTIPLLMKVAAIVIPTLIVGFLIIENSRKEPIEFGADQLVNSIKIDVEGVKQFEDAQKGLITLPAAVSLQLYTTQENKNSFTFDGKILAIFARDSAQFANEEIILLNPSENELILQVGGRNYLIFYSESRKELK